MKPKLKGTLMVILATFFFASSYIINKIVLKSVEAEAINFLQFGFAFIALTIFLIAKGEHKNLQQIKEKPKTVLLVGLFSAIGAIFFINSIKVVGPTTTGFLFQTTAVFSVLLGVGLLKEEFNIFEAVGAAITLTGVMLIGFNGGNILTAGLVLGIGAALFYAGSDFFSKLSVKTISPLKVAWIRPAIAGTISLIYALIMGTNLFVVPIEMLVLIAASAILASAIGQWLFYIGMQLIDFSKAEILKTLESFVIVVFAFVFLASIPSINTLFGGILIIGGVAIVLIEHHPTAKHIHKQVSKKMQEHIDS